MGKKITFFKEAVKSMKTSGSFVPSSKFLVRRILKNIDFEKSTVIVEYGPGNGAITKEILKRLNPNAILLSFEINDVFYDNLKKSDNKQLVALKVSAEDVQKEVEKLGFKKVDTIISSLPLSILPKELAKDIIKKSHKILKDKGQFVQFQYSVNFLKQFKVIFKNKVELEFEPLNFPPAFVYICEK
jgi:phospholipid N-methyltransferase